MKRSAIRAEVTKAITALGFKPNQTKWNGCSIDLVIGGTFRTIRFPAGMSQRALAWELARITGWVEVLSDTFTAVNPHNKVVVRAKPTKKARASTNGHATQQVAA